MAAVVDRTEEFFQAASAQVSAGVRPVSNLPVGKRSPTEEAKAFANKAAEISKKIQLTSKRLSRLANLTRTQGTFDDPGEEINSLAVRLKDDTKFIKLELDQLQAFLSNNKQQVGLGSTNASHHSQTVVETMQLQLNTAAQGFKTLLEERQTSVAKISNRRGLFGAQRAPLSARTGGAGVAAGAPPGASLPRPDGVGVAAQQQHAGSGGASGAGAGAGGLYKGDASGEGDEPEPLIQSSELIRPNRYYESRAEAMSSIESHIVELGGVFSQLSQMVNEHESMVNRIDENVGEATNNFVRGHEELMRTWTGMSGNKWLAAKITMILLMFITFFVTFLA